MDRENNHRSYYRIPDQVALDIKVLSVLQTEQADSYHLSRQREFGWLNQFIQRQDARLPLRSELSNKFPLLMRYVSLLENDLQMLAREIAPAINNLAKEPDAEVNISASGLLFYSNNEIPEDTLLDISIRLFLSNIVMNMLGKVVRTESIEENAEEHAGQWKIAVEFTHFHESDREALIKHIHQHQLIEFSKKSARNGD